MFTAGIHGFAMPLHVSHQIPMDSIFEEPADSTLNALQKHYAIIEAVNKLSRDYFMDVICPSQRYKNSPLKEHYYGVLRYYAGIGEGIINGWLEYTRDDLIGLKELKGRHWWKQRNCDEEKPIFIPETVDVKVVRDRMERDFPPAVIDTFFSSLKMCPVKYQNEICHLALELIKPGMHAKNVAEIISILNKTSDRLEFIKCIRRIIFPCKSAYDVIVLVNKFHNLFNVNDNLSDSTKLAGTLIGSEWSGGSISSLVELLSAVTGDFAEFKTLVKKLIKESEDPASIKDIISLLNNITDDRVTFVELATQLIREDMTNDMVFNIVQSFKRIHPDNRIKFVSRVKELILPNIDNKNIVEYIRQLSQRDINDNSVVNLPRATKQETRQYTTFNSGGYRPRTSSSYLEPYLKAYNRDITHVRQSIINGDLKSLESILSNDYELNESETYESCSLAASVGGRTILEYLLRRAVSVSPLNQNIVGKIFSAAAKGKQLDILKYLLTQPNGIPLPDQNNINNSFSEAVHNQDVSIVQYLLIEARRNYGILPDQGTIINEFRSVNAREFMNATKRESILDLLTPFLSMEELQAQQQDGAGGRGMAYEIHDYAATQVNIPPASSTSSGAPVPSTSMALNDAVIHMIEQRLVGMNVLTQFEAMNLLDASIDEKYPKTAANVQAKEVVRKGWNENTPRRLSFVVSFLNTYHPDSFDAWMESFITESLTAYNGSNGLSCVKGIDERIVTGLRGIDDKLNTLFATPERNKMIKSFFANLNMGEDARAKSIANALRARGVTATSTVDQAAIVYRAFLMEQIASHGGDVREGSKYAKDIDVAVLTFDEDGGYKGYVKPQLKILEDRALVEQQNVEYAAGAAEDLADHQQVQEQAAQQARALAELDQRAIDLRAAIANNSAGAIEADAEVLSQLPEKERNTYRRLRNVYQLTHQAA